MERKKKRNEDDLFYIEKLSKGKKNCAIDFTVFERLLVFTEYIEGM
jgi:hypothetical protein